MFDTVADAVCNPMICITDRLMIKLKRIPIAARSVRRRLEIIPLNTGFRGVSLNI